MSKDTGGSAFPTCARCICTSVVKQGRQWLCAKHYRFGQMRATAKRDSKTVPTHEQLFSMTPPGLRCPECGVEMNWLARDNQVAVVTLQHYRDGRMGLICRSCNTRHAFAPGDSFSAAPKDHKYCPKCSSFKPDSDFTADNSRSGSRRISSWCKPCARTAWNAWKESNRDHINAKQRQRRADFAAR